MPNKVKKGVGGAASTGVANIKKSVVSPTKKATESKPAKKAPSEKKGETKLKKLASDKKHSVKAKKANKKL